MCEGSVVIEEDEEGGGGGAVYVIGRRDEWEGGMAMELDRRE